MNSEKSQAIWEMAPSRTVKEVQCLTRSMVAVYRFLSRSAKKSLPFFKALKQIKNFQWVKESQVTFDGLK